MLMNELLERLSKIEHGFKPIEDEAKSIFTAFTKKESLNLAKEFLKNEHYQIRSLGVFLFGYLSSTEAEALHILRQKVSLDVSWQVQEILAKAFDQFCKDRGYEAALPVIEDWLNDQNPNVCRAVTEGLRIWTSRPFFKENPSIAIQMISRHKSHESEYLRKSVGNALRDISRKHKDLVEKEVCNWDLKDKRIQLTRKLVFKSK
ncbi:MAG: DNA alkylation repair protein [Bacteroidales bacterium]|nr:DNA alkylation repair protein [Bacteroidales bacterium]